MVSEKVKMEVRNRILGDAIEFVEKQALDVWKVRFADEHQDLGGGFDSALRYVGYNKIEEELKKWSVWWDFTPEEAVTIFELCIEEFYYRGRWTGKGWEEKLSNRATVIYSAFVQKVVYSLFELVKTKVAEKWRKHIDIVNERAAQIESGLWDKGDLEPITTPKTHLEVLIDEAWDWAKKLYREHTAVSDKEQLKQAYGF